MLLIKNGRILTITNGIIENGDILINEDKIIEIGHNLEAPQDAQIIDASGKWIMPGIIDCHTHIGLDEQYCWDDINELNELGDPVTPALRCVDGFCPQDPAIGEAIAAGITSVISHTGSIQIISGQSAAFKLVPSGRLEDMILDPCVGIKGGFGGTPKKFYYAMKKMPSTRMGEAAIMRQALAMACSYKNGWRPSGGILWDEEEKLKALQPLIERKIPWRVHVYKVYDIMTVMRIADEFNIRLVLEHCGEAPIIADEIARRNVLVVVGPGCFIGPTKPEVFYPLLENIYKLEEAGVVFAFQTDHPILSVSSLPQAVGIAVKHGLSESAALKALTINAAKVMGKEDRIGSIEVSKDADLIITTGSIFDYNTFVDMTIINGKVVYKRD